jgi:hypothetical protein
MSADLAQNAHGKGDDNLPPKPAASLSFAKPLDEIACQRIVVSTWARVA